MLETRCRLNKEFASTKSGYLCRKITDDESIDLLIFAWIFLLYFPSLYSEFVFDARVEILQERFVTSLSNLYLVCSLKVLHMPLMLGGRPGEMIYLMLNSALWHQQPFGYHLASILLHGLNIWLLLSICRKLFKLETNQIDWAKARMIRLALIVITLALASHTLLVESVAEVSYSSTLLVATLSLSALLLAMKFNPLPNKYPWGNALLIGASCFGAITCKESGIAAPLIVSAYWFIYRRREPLVYWVPLLSTIIIVDGAFLAVRLISVPHGPCDPTWCHSIGEWVGIQPPLWAFMFSQLIYPGHLAVIYHEAAFCHVSVPASIAVLVMVLIGQGWLCLRSRMGALGVAIFWCGLAAVSNLYPLYYRLADRYYYLPAFGLVLQFLGLLISMRRTPMLSWSLVALVALAIIPFSFANRHRQAIFSNEYTLWSEAVRTNPSNFIVQNNLGYALLERHQWNEAIEHFNAAIDIDSFRVQPHKGIAWAYENTGNINASQIHYRRALDLEPDDILIRHALERVTQQEENPARSKPY